MALRIYREVSTGVYAVYGDYGADDGLLPVTSTHDGELGETVELKLFLRNGNDLEYYTNVTVTPESLTVPNDVIGTASGWGVKLKRGQNRPTEAEWDAIDYGAAITFPDFGSAGNPDMTTYRAFWYRVECPAGASAQTKTNIVLTVSYTGNAV